jgi:hypothetical protein
VARDDGSACGDMNSTRRAAFWCPFRAHRIKTPNPGVETWLKPWAEFWPPFRGRTRALPLSCTGLKRYKAGNPRLLPGQHRIPKKAEKILNPASKTNCQ